MEDGWKVRMNICTAWWSFVNFCCLSQSEVSTDNRKVSTFFAFHNVRCRCCYRFYLDRFLIRYGESIWPGTSPRQTELNTLIGNQEPDILAGESGSVAANRPSCRTKWSEWNNACQCFLLYILICISLIHPQELRLSLDSIDLSPTSCNLHNVVFPLTN